MQLRTMKRYAGFFRSCEYMGVAKILRGYLRQPDDFPVPLSLSHGVDMNHCATAMDVDSIEPIHWCTNRDIHRRASPVKPSLLIPHPWVLLNPEPAQKRAETLVIGPPPGRVNDEALRECVRKAGITSYDVLLKYRGDVDASSQFWRDSGVGVVTAGHYAHERFYYRLAEVLGQYERVVGCTVSSALLFASSIDVRCELLTDYRYTVYEVGGYLDTADFTAATARNFVKMLLADDQVGARALARAVLGYDLPRDPEELTRDLTLAMSTLRAPINCRGKNPTLQRTKAKLASLIGRPGLMDIRLRRMLAERRRRRVSLLEINEVDVWANGMNASNIRCEDVAYVRGETEPGFAPVRR